jgi:hypothetical protein
MTAATVGRNSASKADGKLHATFAVAATGGGTLMAGAAPVLTAEEFEVSEVVAQMSSVDIRVSAPSISVGSLLAGLDLEHHALEHDSETGTTALEGAAQTIANKAAELFAPGHAHAVGVALAASSLVEQQANAVTADATETGSLNRLKSLAVDEASLEHAIAELTQEEAEVLLNAIHRRWEHTVTEEAEAVIKAVTASSTSSADSKGSFSTYISSGVDSFSSWFATAQAEMVQAPPISTTDEVKTRSRSWTEYVQSFIYTADQHECATA